MGTGAKAQAPSGAGKKLTAEQRREVKSLIEDGGYTRAEAVAWVTTMGGAS